MCEAYGWVADHVASKKARYGGSGVCWDWLEGDSCHQWCTFAHPQLTLRPASPALRDELRPPAQRRGRLVEHRLDNDRGGPHRRDEPAGRAGPSRAPLQALPAGVAHARGVLGPKPLAVRVVRLAIGRLEARALVDDATARPVCNQKRPRCRRGVAATPLGLPHRARQPARVIVDAADRVDERADRRPRRAAPRLDDRLFLRGRVPEARPSRPKVRVAAAASRLHGRCTSQPRRRSDPSAE